MKSVLLSFICLICFTFTIQAQNRISGSKVDDARFTETLEELFTNYNLYQINIQKDDIVIKGASSQVILDLEGEYFNMNLFEDNVTTSVEYEVQKPHLLGGSLNTGGIVSLTINDNFINGFIRAGSRYVFIENLRNIIKGAEEDIYIVYNIIDVIPNENHVCGLTDMERQTDELVPGYEFEYKSMPTTMCKIVELAIADTYDMVTAEGSVTNVINHNLAVLNNVQTNYRSEFDANLEFDVVAHFVPATSGADPFPSTTDANTLLNFFDGWGDSGGNASCSPCGFGVNYTQASLWTDRNIQSGGNSNVVGLAQLPFANGTFRGHHVLENFSSSSASLMSMVSHEKGHNFDAIHDAAGSNFIMAPSVTLTPNWSTLSKNDIDGQTSGMTYLSNCSTIGAPNANFFQSGFAGCTAIDVEFEDQSQYGATRDWEFFGGTPATSTDEKETVTYNTTGLWATKIVSSNAAGMDSTFNYVDIESAPTNPCTPTGSGGSGRINSVSIGNVSNASTGTGVYEDFACSDVATLLPNTTYDMFINLSNTTRLRWFVDYNNDGDFSDTGESSPQWQFGGSGNYLFSLTTDNSPVTGSLLRFRIITSTSSIASNGCSSPSTGQVEDYSMYFEEPQIFGCTDPAASNYDPAATVDDGTCQYGSSTWFADTDSDNFGDPNVSQSSPTQPAGYVADNTDCDDTDNTVFPGAPELCDGQINNCNTGSLPLDEVDNDSDGYVECIIDAGGWDGVPSVVGGDDCDDNDSNNFPGNTEVCDGQDNDCDGMVDEGVLITYWRDADEDNFGDINISQQACSPPVGFVTNNTDCDDSDDTVFPGAPELCDGQINNCNTGSLPLIEIDNDGDNFVECSIDVGGWDGNPAVIGGEDCDDNDANNYPGNTEVCDGQDNDCDGMTDEGLTATYYRDADNDSFGDNNDSQVACSQPTGYVLDNTDCDDTDNTVYPGAPELCDGQINNCNTGSLPLNEIDNDGDNYVECTIDGGGWDGNPAVVGGDDCDDGDSMNYPGNVEACDGQDNDCDGFIDEGCLPCDGDFLVINTITQNNYRAEINITSDALVNDPQPVNFFAGTDIDLEADFEVILGTEFNAVIEDCIPTSFKGGDNTEFLKSANTDELKNALGDKIKEGQIEMIILDRWGDIQASKSIQVSDLDKTVEEMIQSLELGFYAFVIKQGEIELVQMLAITSTQE